MKELKDNTIVPSRIYYYLLDWNESDSWHTMSSMFGVMKLCELNYQEFTELFKRATKKDIKKLTKPQENE